MIDSYSSLSSGWTTSFDGEDLEMGLEMETVEQEVYETHEIIPVIPAGPPTVLLIGMRWTLNFWFKYYHSRVIGRPARGICNYIWRSKPWNEYKRYIVQDMMDNKDWRNLLFPKRRP